jgi:hypothetical protein
MQRFYRFSFLSTTLTALSLLAVSFGQRLDHRATVLRSLQTWDIPELADHLNRAGLELRMLSPQKNAPILRTAFLTITDKEWDGLNPLIKDPSRFQAWRGTVYCERVMTKDAGELAVEWGDPCLIAGPFVFYGDVELLDRIRAAIFEPARPSHPEHRWAAR